MGCSNDNSVKVKADNEETNQNQDEEESLIEKDFPDFEEYNRKHLIFLF